MREMSKYIGVFGRIFGRGKLFWRLEAREVAVFFFLALRDLFIKDCARELMKPLE